jgi:tetratricopeptide (TPR) repeat protein
VLDDASSISDNPTIRTLWPPSTPLSPPRGSGLTVAARPLLNLSFAVNFALGGLALRGYHLGNVLLHAANAGLVLLLVRRVLRTPSLARAFGAAAHGLATSIALVWALHPLQTESVTYIVQRAESLASFFYLSCLYCVVRSASGSSSSWSWQALAVLACWLGAASKEIVATAPLVALLLDRSFLAGSFGAALRRRPFLYVGLASSWLLLGYLVVGAASRGGTAGWATGMSPLHYAFTQCEAVVRYLGLALWPHPLVFDYGSDVVTDPLRVLPQGLLLSSLLGITAVGMQRRAAWAFPPAFFFVVLAPSSSVIPLATQTAAEHRMYLPLLAVVVLIVLGAWRWLPRPGVLLAGTAVSAALLGTLTFARNLDYRSELVLWSDTVEKRPENPRAHLNLAIALLAESRGAEAEAHLVEAIRLRPSYSVAHFNLGRLLTERNDLPRARVHLEEAARLAPYHAANHNSLGVVLAELGDLGAAAESFRTALRLDPRHAGAAYNLGVQLAALGRPAEALEPLQTAVRLAPDRPKYRIHLARSLRASGQLRAAVEQVRAASKMTSLEPRLQMLIAQELLALGAPQEALRTLEVLRRTHPDLPGLAAALSDAERQAGG